MQIIRIRMGFSCINCNQLEKTIQSNIWEVRKRTIRTPNPIPIIICSVLKNYRGVCICNCNIQIRKTKVCTNKQRRNKIRCAYTPLGYSVTVVFSNKYLMYYGHSFLSLIFLSLMSLKGHLNIIVQIMNGRAIIVRTYRGDLLVITSYMVNDYLSNYHCCI